MLALLLLLSVMPQGIFAEDEGGIVVSVGVYDYTALTYDEALAVSDNGIVAETESFVVEEGATALEVFEAFKRTIQLYRKYRWLGGILLRL